MQDEGRLAMRARNVKPALFKNELLGRADPLMTILFVGLWCVADREGRLEDRPLRLCAELFPYRRGVTAKKVEDMLDWLNQHNFVKRYQHADGVRYVQILNFGKHQRPHPNESPSTIPGPGPSYLNGAPSTIQMLTTDGALPRREALRSDSLIPNSLIPEGGERRASPHAAGKACPPDFQPDLSWALSVLPDLDADLEAQRFKDTEFQGAWRDWAAAWRTYILNCKKSGRYLKLPESEREVPL
jgi:hypothetical protein